MINLISSNKKLSLVIILLAGLVFLFLAAFTFNFYPVAFANGKAIMAYEYNKGFSLAYNYFSYFSQNEVQQNKEELEKTIKKVALEGLIDDVFVNKKLQSEMKSSELEEKINLQVEEMLRDEKFSQTLSDIVKVSKKDIKKYFLENQAKYQILDGRLRLEGKNTLDWILEKRKEAKITILLPGVEWKGDEVEIK